VLDGYQCWVLVITGGKLEYHNKLRNLSVGRRIAGLSRTPLHGPVTEVEKLKSESFQLSVFETEHIIAHTNTKTEFRNMLYRFVHIKVTFHLCT
jgi:hypothetical protein